MILNNKNETVKSFILKRIQSKVYSEGQMIDSENTLCQLLDVSRMTVRKALDELVNDGVLYKEKGRGTFVSMKPKYSEFQCGVAFTNEVEKRGRVPSTKDATLELLEADELIADDLKICKGDKVWRVTRVRCADGIPIIYAIEYFVYAQCENLTLDIVNQSVYGFLETKGITFAFVDQKLEAVLCPSDVAKKLSISKGEPLILMSITAYMKNGTPFNTGIEYYRTDQYTLIQSVYANGVRY